MERVATRPDGRTKTTPDGVARAPDPPGPSRLRMVWFQLIQLAGLSWIWIRWLKVYRWFSTRMGWTSQTPLQKYGNVIRYPVAGFTYVAVLGPEEIRRVLEDHHTNYERHPLHRMFVPVLGNGLLSTFGEEWKRRRRRLQPAFQRGRIAGLREAMAAAIAPAVDGWGTFSSIEVDIVHECRELALNIAARTMFPRSLATDFSGFHDALRLLAEETPRRILPWPRWPDWVPTPHNRRLRSAVRTMRDTVRQLVSSGSVSDHDDPSVLGILLAARHTGEDAFTEDELIDEALTMLAAGYDTTASLLAWTLIELADHAAVQDRLCASLAADGGPDGYLEQVLDETMRLHPPVPVFVRRTVTEDVLGGYRMRAKETILLVPSVTHRHPDYWHEPDRFDPDRFEPAQVKSRPRYAFFPFGGGPHRCIGEHFALLEATVVVGELVRRFRLTRKSTAEVGARGAISLQPVGPVPLELTRR